MQRTLIMPAERRLYAIALMCGAIFCFSALDATAKYLSGVVLLPVMQIIWVRFAVHAALNVVFFGGPARVPRLLKAQKPGYQWLRSLFMLGATFFNFLAVSYLRLDQTVTIFFLTPLIVSALAGPLLGEWVGWRRLLAILVGFLGVLLVMRPGFGGIHWAIVYSFAATLSYALYNIVTRYLAAHDRAEVTNFYSPLAGVILMAPLALSSWQTPSAPHHWLLMLFLGVSGGFGHWLLIHAHRYASAPTVAPFVYSGLIWMTILGYVLFGDVPDLWTLAGGAVVIGSGLYLLWRERRHTSPPGNGDPRVGGADAGGDQPGAQSARLGG